MDYKILDKADSPDKLKLLPERDIPLLCQELRSFLIDKVGKSGGHLASNLGVVELSVALHRCFDSPRDHIIFDVGHQAYVHKILTGRADRFDDLRVPGGLSGFTRMSESAHDAFGAGHSSTSISAALGYAETDVLSGSDAYTVCVIGDGAYTGGMVHEALNNCKPDLKLIIVLNENGMSISDNKGTFANYLSKVRASAGYNKWKQGTNTALQGIPLVGKPIRNLLSAIKNQIKKMFMRPNYFEELGLYYIGAIDGNDYKKVSEALERAKSIGKCVVVHLKTVKGKGYVPAENAPTEFHSVRGTPGVNSTFHSVFAEELIKMAENDRKVLAVTAAMGAGTGLESFGELYSDRYFDVGIAEEHALTFSAGLAANGYLPYVAIYSTFLQRGYDNILHDIALQDLPVKIVIDRAGLAVADGATHHGIFDVSFLSHAPGVELYAPASYSSLRKTISAASSCSHPIAIRYANATELDFVDEEFAGVIDTEAPLLRTDFPSDTLPEAIFITYGQIVSEVMKAKHELSSQGISTGIILVEKIKPYDEPVSLIAKLISGAKQVVFVEEGIKNGGAAMITKTMLSERGFDFNKTSFDIIAIDDNFAAPDSKCNIYDYVGLSAEKIIEFLKKKT